MPHPGMRYIDTFLFVLLSTLPVSGKVIEVVTTSTDLMSVTQAVGGEYVSVTSIGNGKQDLHFIEAKPSYMLRLRKADLFVRIGLEMEIGWERLVIEGSRNPRIRYGSPGHLDASEGLQRLEVPAGPVDRSMGDIHPSGNPHYWLDPYNMRIIAGTIARRLGELDPPHRETFLQNAGTFARKIDAAMFGEELVSSLDAEKLWRLQISGELEEFLEPGRDGTGGAATGSWYSRMLPMRGEKVITYHRNWSYLLNRFGMVSLGELEPKPGINPSPGHLLNIIDTVRRNDVQLILVVSFKQPRAPRMVASKTGARVVLVPYSVGGHPEAYDYLALMDYLVSQISAAAGRQRGEE